MSFPVGLGKEVGCTMKNVKRVFLRVLYSSLTLSLMVLVLEAGKKWGKPPR